MFVILDHDPHASTAGALARIVGVEPRDVETTDPAHQESNAPMPDDFHGRHARDTRDHRWRQYRCDVPGQSLGVPPGATPTLRLADTATDRDWVRETKSFRQSL